MNFGVGLTTSKKKLLVSENLCALSQGEQGGGIKRLPVTVLSDCSGMEINMSTSIQVNSGYAQNFRADVAGSVSGGNQILPFKYSLDGKVGYTWSGNDATSTTMNITAKITPALTEPTDIVICSGAPCDTPCYNSDPCQDLLNYLSFASS